MSKSVDITLGSGDFDLEEIFTRLDDRYGDPGKITDSIICEIQRFKKSRCGESEDLKRSNLLI